MAVGVPGAALSVPGVVSPVLGNRLCAEGTGCAAQACALRVRHVCRRQERPPWQKDKH